MNRIIICASLMLTLAANSASAQIRVAPSTGQFNFNPAAMSSSSVPPRTTTTFYNGARPFNPNFNGINNRFNTFNGFNGGFIPFGFYGYGDNFGNPNFFPGNNGFGVPSNGMNRESAIFAPANDGLEATIPSLSPIRFPERDLPLIPPTTIERAAPARFIVEVPDSQAKVWLEGQSMKGEGDVRRFVSPPLQPGQDYLYDILVRWNHGSTPVEKKKTITVRAGDQQHIVFTDLR